MVILPDILKLKRLKYLQKCKKIVNPLDFHHFWLYNGKRKKLKKVLRGGVKVPTGGIVRELPLAVDPVGFRDRQYSLDERRRCGCVDFFYMERSQYIKSRMR